MILKKRKLASTNLEVSILSFGTVKIGRNYQVKNKTPDGFHLPSDQEVLELLEICKESGINLIDTAPAYGIAEERIGKLLGAKRKDFLISTKCGEEFDGQTSSYDFSKKHLNFSIERSLQRLQTDYLDIVLLHLPRNDLEILKNSDGIETLLNLKDQGKILAVGASTHTVEGGIYALENLDLAMIPFNPDYQEHLAVIDRARELNKGILIKKGLLSGHLDQSNPEVTLKKCFQVALQNQVVTSLVIGTINPKHLEQNINLCWSLI